jgi:cell division protein FtsB
VRAQWIVPAVLAVGVMVTLTDQTSGLSTWLRLSAELGESQARIFALEAETAGLRAEISALSGNDFALERAIREDLELARPGEVVVRFARPMGHAATPSNRATRPSQTVDSD